MRRTVVIPVLVFQSVFLNIVIPGHVRGIVTLAGKSSAKELRDLVGGGCCQKCIPESPDKNKKPTPTERANCAICFLAAHLSVPPVVDFRLTDLGPTDIVRDAIAQFIEPITFVHTYDACAPPALG